MSGDHMEQQLCGLDAEPAFRAAEDTADEFRCPFCKEMGFDAIGLKSHLQHEDCEAYAKLPIGRPRLF